MSKTKVMDKLAGRQSRLAKRFRNINILVIVIVLLIVTAVGSISVYTLADNASKDYVRFYTLETVDILSLHLTKEIALVQQAARAKEIAEWFSDEKCPHKKAAAYEKMMHYAEILQIDGVYFAVLSSGHEYFVDKNAPFEKFKPIPDQSDSTRPYILSRSVPYDNWFFSAVESDFDFTLNIDVDKISNTRRMWINHKVIRDGHAVGILSSAMQFDKIFEELFGRYDNRSVTGYVIGEKGYIQLSSKEHEPKLMRSGISASEARQKVSILSINSDPVFINAISQYTENAVIYHGQRIEPAIIKLPRGHYRYVSIAPIPNTNWSTVTFYSSSALFNSNMLVLPAIALLLAFLVYISVNTMLTQRLLFMPLAKLTGSVHDVNHDSGKIYGMERKDEIGELARAALDAWSDLNSQTIAIKQRDTLLQAGNQAAALLLDADMEKFEDSLYRSMGIMAKAVNADRVYIFKNHLHEGDLCTTQLYEWSEGATPQQGTKYTVNVSYSKTIPDWGEALSKGECVNSIIHDMWPLSREFMEATQIVSVFIAPIFVKDEFWGFVGFDDCENERKFTENEASILRSACLLIGDAFLRNDITKNLQETADKLEERTRSLELETTMLSTLFDSIPDLIFVKDLSLSYLQCNKSFAEYFACSKEEMIGKSDTDADGVAFSDEEAREYNERDRKVINERKTIVVEEYVPRADGVKQLFETIKAPLVLNGEVIGILGIARDITLRKEMEEAVLGASRSKSAFMASMSHEIRTPMNSIIGFSELAQDDDIPEKTKDYLQKIQSNSEWLLQIINDILDISKIESGKMVLENIPLDLHSIFASCRTVIMPKAIEKGLVMHFYAEPSVGKRLYGDPTRLRQVLVNLLSNAVKFTNSGMIKMQAFVKSVAANSITMCFEVKDSGIGITPEQMVTIFDPFIQAETGTTRKYGGSGLGLSITKNIVEMMGGDLSAESIPGVGTKFSFEIKFDAIDIADDEKLEELIVFDDLEKPTFVGEILLCEDNAMNQQVVREHLARVGLKTVVAENGEEGVCIVKNRVLSGGKEFDLIFMDIHMPVMDGLEAAFKISALNIKTPIVALTANIMSNDLELYKTNGMSGYLGKPFTSKELWKCLAKYIPVASLSEADANQLHKEDEKLLRRLRVNFVRDNENTYDKIINAVGAGDMVLAYRLAHTLKSNAAQLGKKQLQYAAEAVETMLSEGKNLLTEEQTESLKKELKSVLDELAPFIAKAAPVKKLESVDKEKALALIEKLEPLIINSDTASLKFLDELYAVFGDGKFARQIEDFEFKLAAATLEILKRKLAAQ